MSAAPLLALVAAVSYLTGAVPFGYLVARARGVDILRLGSGNIGATNVGRVLGRRFGVLVFLLDFAKGALPVLVAGALAPAGMPPEWPQVTAGVAAFLGHLFPVYLGFRGGKGVATGAGVVAVLVPGPAAGAAVTWAGVAVATRYVSLASLTAAAMLCVLRVALTPEPWSGPAGVVTGFCLVAAALVAVRHRANVGRLLRGTENRLKEGPAMSGLARTLHVLAVGLWFGSAVFFTVTGLVVFDTFERLTAEPGDQRPAWLPLPPLYDKPPPSPRFPQPLRKEQGARVAGAVVGPLFPIYFGLQAGCGAVAFLTALGWSRAGGVHALRVTVLLTALACVAGGWLLARVVGDLRGPRDDTTDAVLRISAPSAAEVAAAEAARRAFTRWHLASVLLNLATLALVAVAAVLAAWPPAGTAPAGPAPDTKLADGVTAAAAVRPPSG